MASTGAVVYMRHRANLVVSVSRTTGAVVNVPFRCVSGLYTGIGIASATNDRNRRPSMPTRDVPFLRPDGGVNEPWYQWMHYHWTVKQGGVTSPTVPEVAESITTAQVTAIASEQIAKALQQQTEQNASVVYSIREVVQGAALPGAEQIARPQLTSGEGGSE